jgi:sulfur carrier protein ThiS
VKVTILPARELREVDAGDVGQLLKELNLHQDAYLVIRSDEILTRDVKLKSSDEVEIWPVISGGRR